MSKKIREKIAEPGEDQPTSCNGIPIIWIDNKPRFKAGDNVVVYSNTHDVYRSVVLEGKPVQGLKSLKTTFGIDWNKKDKAPVKINKYWYLWRDQHFAEGQEVEDIGKLLTTLCEKVKTLTESNQKNSEKAARYDSIVKGYALIMKGLNRY